MVVGYDDTDRGGSSPWLLLTLSYCPLLPCRSHVAAEPPLPSPCRLWFALDLEVTLEHGDPLAHAGEADLLTWVGPVRSVVRHEPQPPVADLEANLLRPALKRDVRPVRSRVPTYVRERLLSNSKERRLYNFWQAFFFQRFLVACPKTLTGKPLHLQAERSPQPEVVKHRGSQVGDHVAGFLDRVLWHLQRFIELIFAAGE